VFIVLSRELDTETALGEPLNNRRERGLRNHVSRLATED
jgi:hypothetical protein